ncbi:Solitary outer membrane autotransporter beta-barrel domain [Thalassotalea litorea]|uniref:Solitary outer membrane autotransporter beta-barrel domain n=1 Tax=Thalassotalea litorea TaxID=2020715 RepID=UPI003736149D
MQKSAIIFICALLNLCRTASAQDHEEMFSPSDEFSQIYASSVVLMDSDALSFGVGNFDPEEILQPNNNNLNTDSIDLRNQISVFSIPYTIELGSDLATYQDYLQLQVAYIKQKGEVSLEESLTPDLDKEEVFAINLSIARQLYLDKNWSITPTIAAYFLHYKNTHSYNSELSQSLQEELDALLFNQKKNAIIIEPGVEFAYLKDNDWGSWEFKSELHYMQGRTTSRLADGEYGYPNGWRVINGFKLKNTFAQARLFANDFYLKANRIDITGDTVTSLGTRHYYEVGFGILWDLRNMTDLVENVGIGININHGSAVSGGSIVLYFNEW